MKEVGEKREFIDIRTNHEIIIRIQKLNEKIEKAPKYSQKQTARWSSSRLCLPLPISRLSERF